jgi:UDP-2,3-diacylglucosamine hydrolase
MSHHFISDLHLSEDTPALCQLFANTLRQWQGQIDSLFILGDLFEYWVGDDDDSAFLDEMLAAMQQFSRHTPLYVMHGNRDFLLGDGFAQRSGAVLLADPYLLEAYGRSYLLSHGDALCTADTAYQQFRTISRNPAWQAAMLARPLAERHAIAAQARMQSEAAKLQQGLSAITDVSDDAVMQLLAQHHWPTLIHGHTHRPATHLHQQGSQQAERWVIRDWHGSSGGYLRLDASGLTALPLG